MVRQSYGVWIGAMTMSALAGCSANADNAVLPVDAVEQAVKKDGKKFNDAVQHTNGRACGTCHLENAHTALTATAAQALFAVDPTNALFHPIDADDPNAASLTFEHLKKGLVRIKLVLPANVDLMAVPPNAVLFSNAAAIGFENSPAFNQVVTPADRTIELWRGVPSVENTAYTAGFQFDGRAADLEAQAMGALLAHSQLSGAVGNGIIKQIVEFEASLFTSNRAEYVQQQIAAGVPDSQITKPEDLFPLTDPDPVVQAQLDRGSIVYERACTGCHGGPRDNQLQNPALRPFLALKADGSGNVQFTRFAPGGPSVPVTATHAPDPFMNIGTSFLTAAGQAGLGPVFNTSVALPRYRLRFYTDATRTVKLVDLPPIPHVAGNPFTAALDADGHPIVGPNLVPQAFTNDPGRALITGDPQDFEAFDIPQLRGIANTAPYFHDNSAENLVTMVDIYSQFILPFVRALNLPPVNPSSNPAVGGESLSAQQKADLVKFLERF